MLQITYHMPDKNGNRIRKRNRPLSGLRKRFKLFRPFWRGENEILRERIVQQEQQIRMLNNILGAERKRSAQLALLSEVEQHLKTVLDQPVAAQLIVNAVQRALNCNLVAVLTHDDEHKEFVALAVAGDSRIFLPPSYRQSAETGLIGRAARQRRAVVTNDTRAEPEYVGFENHTCLSEMIIPLIQHGNLKGMLTVDHQDTNMFSLSDLATLEIVSEQLMGAWERSNYHQRLTELIQAGITLSTLQDAEAVIEQVATIARKTLEARFTFVTLLDHEGSFTRTAYSGNIPQLLRTLKKNPEKDPIIQATLNASHILRVRDLKKSSVTIHLKQEPTSVRGMLAFPIRLHQLNIGVILAFGKQGQTSFTENDESLANLIASQTAAAIESTWLYQELRSTLQTATLLNQLSTRIMQAENLNQAAADIAKTAFKMSRASLTGIVLYTPDHNIQAQVEVDANGIQTGTSHPQQMIQQALQTGQTIIISDDRFASKICVPLQTPHRVYGALWLDIPEGRWFKSRYSTNLQTLVNQATVALERSMLLVQTRNQANQLEAAYDELEKTYDQTLSALISSLDARDRETEGHSARVGRISCRLGEMLGLTYKQVKALERGALLHDIGKIGVSDAILLKPGPLTEKDWLSMRQHPEIGARIIEQVPFLAETTTVIRYHHERWDGTGYPLGMHEREIPLLARIFAVADAFDALVNDRPYRKGTSETDAISYLRSQAGILFDPEIVEVFTQMLVDGKFKDILSEK